MKRWWCAAVCAVSLLGGRASAGDLEDWLGWSVERRQEDLEELLGVDVGGRLGVDITDVAWWMAADDPTRVDQGGRIVQGRPGLDLSLRLVLSASWARDPAAAVLVTLGLSRGPRYGLRRLAPPRRPATPTLPRRSGDLRLDRVLWELARLEHRDRSRAVDDVSLHVQARRTTP